MAKRRPGSYAKYIKLMNDVQRQPVLKADFIKDPRGFMEKYGLEVPKELNIIIKEDGNDTRYIVIPHWTKLAAGKLDESIEAKLGRRAANPWR